MIRISTAGKLSNGWHHPSNPHPAVSRCLKDSGDAGFTLIELIVVCALIGIMLSLAVPSFRTTIVNDPLKATVRKSIGLVREVRETAARRHTAYILHIDHIENSMWFEPEEKMRENEKSEEEKSEEKEGESVLKKWNVPEDIKITGLWVAGEKKSVLESTSVWISPEGYLENTVISFEDEDGRSLAVEFQTFLDDAIIHDQVPSQ